MTKYAALIGRIDDRAVVILKEADPESDCVGYTPSAAVQVVAQAGKVARDLLDRLDMVDRLIR